MPDRRSVLLGAAAFGLSSGPAFGKALAGFKGELLRPKSPAYEAARRGWNLAYDRRPALIARCADADDARRALDYAFEDGRPFVVRSGGHAYAGASSVDDGVVADLAGLRSVEVDRDRLTVRMGPGARAADVATALDRAGLMMPLPAVGNVGLGGATLGGGLGGLAPALGLTADALTEAEIVLADGRRERVAEGGLVTPVATTGSRAPRDRFVQAC